MIKDKEYPATHSMSTSWFGIDKDGNVAIIDFNENGPVPPNLDEYCGEDIIESVFPSRLDDVLYEIPLTDAQAEDVIQYLHISSPDENIDFEHIVKINPDYTKEFISTVSKYPIYGDSKRKTIRLSERFGLYLCNFYDIPKRIIKSLISKGIIQRNLYFDWNFNEKFNEETDRWDISADICSCIFPFYYYVQPYSTNQLIEKINEPDNPVSEYQISPNIRHKALMFPFSFKDQKEFQILEYYHATSNDDRTTDNYEHIRVPLTDGTEGIVQTSFLHAISCKNCNMCNLEDQVSVTIWSFLTDKPTGIIISGMMRQYDWQEIIEDSYKQCVDSNPCWRIPGHTILPYLEDDEQMELLKGEKGRKWFSIIADNIIDAAETLKPYCLLVESRLMPIIEDLFPVEDSWITLGSQKMRIFESDKLTENKSEIESLLSKPYRGCVFERIHRLTDK